MTGVQTCALPICHPVVLPKPGVAGVLSVWAIRRSDDLAPVIEAIRLELAAVPGRDVPQLPAAPEKGAACFTAWRAIRLGLLEGVDPSQDITPVVDGAEYGMTLIGMHEELGPLASQ